MATDPSFFGPHGVSEDSLWLPSPNGDPDDDFTATAYIWRALQYDNNDGDYDDAKKAKDEAVRIDYSVLSVGVMTLGLIMIVELGRHKLDHVAHHKPFLKAVLEGVYEELATLGIVEFLLHIMQEYYEQYDKDKKHVFADVHFLLFYTAILNALQSLLLHYVARRMSERLWVQTEMLELNHYVEIREEFENVKRELDQLHNRTPMSTTSHACTSDDGDVDKQELGDSGKRVQRGPTETAEDAFALNQDYITEALQSLMDRIRYPALKTKYNELLLQIRFHEMRVHFLQAYNLPLKLRISDYLFRSEEKVMLKLVHVSPLAWLLLTGVINFAYFVLGIVSYKVQDPQIIGETMIAVFFCAISLFVFMSWLVKNKMKAVFKTIMNSETLWNVEYNDADQHGVLAEQQRALFWGGDPKLVMAAIQFMQFGYAVSISTIIIFFEEINDGNVPMVLYFWAIVICYSVFLVVIAQAIPRYTLCTSLGQLVNERQLHETLAAFHLEEARLRDMEDSDDERCRRAILSGGRHKIVTSVLSEGRSKVNSSGSISGDSSLSSSRHDRRIIHQESANAALMFEMVRTKTDALRSQLPASEMARLEQRQMQKNRVKQFSDGVSAMSCMKADIQHVRDDLDLKTSTNSADQVGDLASIQRSDHRARRKAMSEGVALMASTMQIDERSNDDQVSRQPESTRTPVVDGDDDNASVGTDCSGYSDDDNASVGTDCSGYSDANDIPEVDRNLALKELNGQNHKAPKILLRVRLFEYFMSRRYVAISNIFGTMVAFFFVGQRIESFLHSEGIANERFTHFDFAHDYVFWLLSAWLMFFMTGAVLIMYTFDSFDSLNNNKERQILLSGIFDLVISGACLAIFFIAEGQRCCYNLDGMTEYESSETTSQCSCLPFGRRLYGGLGRIEPYVSLVALRLFRFWLAKRIVLNIDSKNGWKKNTNQRLRNESIPFDPLDVFGKSERHGCHGHDEVRHSSHGEHENGDGATAAELWENAVAKHPEIVAKYGQFSGELLRAMLGLHVDCGPSHGTTTAVNEGLDTKESHLVVHEQSRDEVETDNSHPAGCLDVSTMVEKPGPMMIRRLSTAELMRTSSLSLVTPTVSAIRISSTDAALDSLFASPNARLVRRMRRCDRKFIPFLSKWSAVDVALTRFEMVYFEAVNVDGEASLDAAGDVARQAVMATKGGKGLRLCDVAAGRRIVGRLHFSEINSVHVERRMPHESAGDGVECSEVEVEKNELWKYVAGRSSEANSKRGAEWCTVKQDRLKIHTIHGHVLYLRFYSDLEDAQNHVDRLSAEDEHSGFLYKNNAFQWAQTIARVCGPGQLKQMLPHFGDDTSEELRDFLIVDNGAEIQKGHRRVRTGGSDRVFGLLRLRVYQQVEI